MQDAALNSSHTHGQSPPLFVAENLSRDYAVKRGVFGKMATVKALANVSFTLNRGETLAVVGESGSGKTTLARLITMIESPTSGTLRLNGTELTTAPARERKAMRKMVQMVFQDPYGSLNPRQTIGEALAEPLLINSNLTAHERDQRVKHMIERVGLRADQLARYPHMFSGGQRQRIAIARALMLHPQLVILDEPVSALDLSIRAQVLNLLKELQEELKLAYLFITHDLAVAKYISHQILVLYLGRVVELGAATTIFTDATHPYSRALLSASPIADPGIKKERIILKGDLPSPYDPPLGCQFHPRCPIATAECSSIRPELSLKRDRLVACLRVA